MTRNRIVLAALMAVMCIGIFLSGCQAEPTAEETKKMFTGGQKDPGESKSATADTSSTTASAPANPSQDDAKK